MKRGIKVMYLKNNLMKQNLRDESNSESLKTGEVLTKNET